MVWIKNIIIYQHWIYRPFSSLERENRSWALACWSFCQPWLWKTNQRSPILTRPGFMLISKALTKIFWASPSPYSCTLTPTLGLELVVWGSATPQICSHSQFCPLPPLPCLPCLCTLFTHSRPSRVVRGAVWLVQNWEGWGREGWQWIGNDLCRPADPSLPPKPWTQPCRKRFLGLSTAGGLGQNMPLAKNIMKYLSTIWGRTL